MSRWDNFLLALIFILIGLFAVIKTLDWQQGHNNELMIKKLTEQVSKQQKQISDLERKQSLLQSDLAQTGIYDKKK